MAASNVILVGFSGTGKTLVGQVVARSLGWEFLDSDLEIAGRAGKPVSRIFSEDGETAFRVLEKQVLRDVCSMGSRVISTGGGAMVDSEIRDFMLSQGYVVCLDADPQTIFRRLSADETHPGESRPMLAGADPLERIRSLKDSRRRYYSMAHETVYTDNLSVEEVAEKVIRAWKSATEAQRHGEVGDGSIK